MYRRFIILLAALLLAACNLSVPQPTPTVAPTRTPSQTPFSTNTPLPTVIAQVLTNTPTLTLTPLPTDTPTATLTLTATPTNRPSITPTLTFTPSSTFTAAATNQPTATATYTPSSTATPQPTLTFTPADTNTPQPTFTPIPTASLTATPTNTLVPSLTPTRTLSPDELAQIETQLAPAQPTQAPVELSTAVPPPTLPATPTFITLEAPATTSLEVSPVVGQTTPQSGPPTFTPSPQPTVFLRVTLAPIVTAAPIEIPTSLPTNPLTRAFALSTSGGVVGTGFNLLNDVTLFERNPVDPNLYMTTDSSGNMLLTGVNGAGAYRPDMSPFSQFIPRSRAENNAYVAAASWSPDGRYLAFIVAGRQLSNDGIWFFEPGKSPPLQLMVDCPKQGFPGCGIVKNPVNPDLWESQTINWSPTSDALLVGLSLPGENRPGILILPITNNERARDVRPNIFRYDFGSWETNGNRVLVSGRGEDGHVFVGWLNRDGSFAELVYDAEANGLWMGFANQARSGQIYALGAPGDRGGPREPLRLYNMNGQALTQPIGDGFPQRVTWSPDGSAAFVQVNGRQFIARINGEIREITGQVAGARAINWVNGGLPPGDNAAPPPSNPNPPSSSIPSGVVAGSQYQPGQQLRVYVVSLNIRQGPGVGYGFARPALITGEYVAILAGPVNADNVTWWQVQTADGVVGWIAGEINGAVTLGP
jgi:hypothetical protein